MNKLFALALVTLHGAAFAQTPAVNPMPDGSRDMYVGLGAQSAPRYEGAKSRKVNALPVLQIQWSNGIFVSGMAAGMHLSSQPSMEFGPMLALQAGRTASGLSSNVGGVDTSGLPTWGPPTLIRYVSDNPLDGMDDIKTRLLGGAFFNYYVAPEWRLTSSVLYGAGNDRNGGKLDLGVQRLSAQVAAHHTLSLSAGVTVANRQYNSAYFGVSSAEALRSGHLGYYPKGGLKDVHVGARWNWALSPSWMLTSYLQAARLQGDAKDSPLVQRPTNVTVSTALAYRF
ncbi:MAG TPA: MipA/OmpV family protein [Telluria sp.]|nr:MipA/OmpV family protein [Telluria sp.]